MGGHAVRFYGLSRNTIDFDLHLAPDSWAELSPRLAGTPLFAGKLVLEGPSWRPNSFRRFLIGRLSDGREEWLEFWCENHLLPSFSELYARREQGLYGGRFLSFLALPDLIKSKETGASGGLAGHHSAGGVSRLPGAGTGGLGWEDATRCPQPDPQPERVRDGTPEGSILGRSSRRTGTGSGKSRDHSGIPPPFHFHAVEPPGDQTDH